MTSLSYEQQAVLVGTLMGDACLCRHNPHWNAQLSFVHSSKQAEYLLWKVSVLAPFFRASPYETYGTLQGYSKTHVSLRVSSRNHPSLTKFHSIFYTGEGGKKSVTTEVLSLVRDSGALALAVWYMDDGTRDKSASCFTLGGLSQCEYKRIASWFEQCGFRGSLCSHHGRHGNWATYRMSTESSRDFREHIRPHMHTSMLYKVQEI